MELKRTIFSGGSECSPAGVLLKLKKKWDRTSSSRACISSLLADLNDPLHVTSSYDGRSHRVVAE